MLSYGLTATSELRLLMPHHAVELAAVVSKNADHIGRWLQWATPEYDEDAARVFIQRALQKLVDNNGMELGIFHENRLAGVTGYLFWDWRSRRTEIGYWLAAEYQGQGLMTRAVKALTGYALGELGLNRVEIRMDVENDRSAAIPERLGYTFEGVRHQYDYLNGEPRDTRFFVMLAENWHS